MRLFGKKSVSSGLRYAVNGATALIITGILFQSAWFFGLARKGLTMSFMAWKIPIFFNVSKEIGMPQSELTSTVLELHHLYHRTYLSPQFITTDWVINTLNGLNALNKTIALLAILLLVRKILFAFSGDQPFEPHNTKRIKWIGWIIIFSELLERAIEVGLGKYISGKFSYIGGQLEYSWVENSLFRGSMLTILFLGAMLVLISEVFKRGSNMKEEQDLTV